jgi:uncharacterized protein YuzE
MSYFSGEDVLHLTFSGEEEANSIELSPGITAELNRKGQVIGVEILHATTFVRDTILERAPTKLLRLIAAGER